MVMKVISGGLSVDAVTNSFAASSEVDFTPYEDNIHTMYAFIRHEGGDGVLTSENTALFWHDTTYLEAEADCCIIISGRIEGQPDCESVFGKYIQRDRSDSGGTISPNNIVASMIAKGDKCYKDGEYKKATEAYEHAFMIGGGTDFELGRKLCASYVITDRMEILPIISHLINLYGESAMTGVDYALYAVGLYAYMTEGKEELPKKEIQELYHVSARQLMLDLIGEAKNAARSLLIFRKWKSMQNKEKAASAVCLNTEIINRRERYVEEERTV